MKVKELICWFKILHSERETKKGGFFIIFKISMKMPIWTTISLWSYMPSAKVFPFFTYLSQTKSPPVPICSHLAFCALTSGLLRTTDAMAHVVPRRECGEPARVSWTSYPQHLTVTTDLWMPSLHLDSVAVMALRLGSQQQKSVK